jgi:hypothetical protein
MSKYSYLKVSNFLGNSAQFTGKLSSQYLCLLSLIKGEHELEQLSNYHLLDQENVVSIHNGILCSHEEERNIIICR